MKSGEGIIAEVLENDRVKIQVGREHLFTACSSCIGAERVVVTAKNTVHAKKKDKPFAIKCRKGI